MAITPCVIQYVLTPYVFYESESGSVMSYSLQPHGLYSPWNSLGQNTGVGSLSLLQQIFPTQGSNPGLPHCRQILYQLSHKGSPRILEWVAYPFSRGSSWPRNRTGVSCVAGRFSTSWATWEAHLGLFFWQGSLCEYPKVINNGKQGNWSHWCFITTVLSGHVEGIRGGKPGDVVLGRYAHCPSPGMWMLQVPECQR